MAEIQNKGVTASDIVNKLKYYTEKYGTLDENRLRQMAFSFEEAPQSAFEDIYRCAYWYYYLSNNIHTSNAEKNNLKALSKSAYFGAIPAANAVKKQIENAKYKRTDDYDTSSRVKLKDITSPKNYSSSYENAADFANVVDNRDQNKVKITPEGLAEQLCYYGDMYYSIQQSMDEEEHYRRMLNSGYSDQVSAAERYFKLLNDPSTGFKAVQPEVERRYNSLSNVALGLKGDYLVRFLKAYLAKNPYWETSEQILSAKNTIANGG